MIHLDLIDLRKAYGAVQVVDGVHLSAAPGEFVTLLGPSGCGKTTTLRCIAGFVTPDAGDIRIDQESVLRTKPAQRNFGVVFQNYALFPHLTVHENIAYGLQSRAVPRDEIRKRVVEALSMVRLTGLERRLPRELSGGQQQRVALARAIVIRPRLLLLDEPLANLDAKLRQELRSLIRDVQRAHATTAIYVTHDHAEAMALSDRIAVMRHGRIAQIGTPRDIYRRPFDPYVAAFTGDANALTARIVAEAAPGNYRIAVAGTELAACGPPGLPPGSTRSLLARPEALARAPAGEGGLPVDLKVVAFAGAVQRCEAVTADGQTLVWQMPAGEAQSAGERLTLAVDATQTWLMAPAEAA